jgi:hypothetical protein
MAEEKEGGQVSNKGPEGLKDPDKFFKNSKAIFSNRELTRKYFDNTRALMKSQESKVLRTIEDIEKINTSELDRLSALNSAYGALSNIHDFQTNLEWTRALASLIAETREQLNTVALILNAEGKDRQRYLKQLNRILEEAKKQSHEFKKWGDVFDIFKRRAKDRGFKI